VTEIPEHLLKRSRERRSAMGGGDDAGGGDSAGGTSGTGGDPAATPAKAAASTPAAMPAHPAPVEEAPPPPPSPMVQAYQRRNKIPFWAMPVLAILPVWAYVYVGTLSPPPAGEGPEVLGEEAYAGNGCAGCHGGGGGGGVGPAFTGGAIYETFPTFETHFQWVRLGSEGWRAEVGDTYGATDKPVNGGMPGFGEDSVDDAHLLYLILHERMSLGGENPSENDQLRIELAAEIFMENPEMTLDEVLAQVDEEIPAEGGGEGGGGGTEGGAVEGQGDAELEGPEGNEASGTDDAEPVNP
jgi:mono/diheme cytochrome c family protein